MPARAMSSLHRQRLELARLRQGDALANRLLAELESVRRSLTEASREAAGYPARQVELSRLEREVAQAREEADRNDRRIRDLDLLVRLWDVLERKRTAEQRLACWKEPEPLTAWLETQATELQSLRSACSGHLERVGQLDDLYNQRRGIEQSIQAAMGSLGPTWDRDRVRTSDGWRAGARPAPWRRTPTPLQSSPAFRILTVQQRPSLLRHQRWTRSNRRDW